jgi:hypothetical protein
MASNSATVVESAVPPCFEAPQCTGIALSPHKEAISIQAPLVDFVSSFGSPARSASGQTLNTAVSMSCVDNVPVKVRSA